VQYDGKSNFSFWSWATQDRTMNIGRGELSDLGGAGSGERVMGREKNLSTDLLSADLNRILDLTVETERLLERGKNDGLRDRMLP